MNSELRIVLSTAVACRCHRRLRWTEDSSHTFTGGYVETTSPATGERRVQLNAECGQGDDQLTHWRRAETHASRADDRPPGDKIVVSGFHVGAPMEAIDMHERSWTATVDFDWPAEPETAAFSIWLDALDGMSPAIGYRHRRNGTVVCSASLTVTATNLREAVDAAVQMVENATKARALGIDALPTDELDRPV